MVIIVCFYSRKIESRDDTIFRSFTAAAVATQDVKVQMAAVKHTMQWGANRVKGIETLMSQT